MTAAPMASASPMLPEAGGEDRHQGAGRDQIIRRKRTTRRSSPRVKSLNLRRHVLRRRQPGRVKLAKQAYDIIPKMIKAGGDGMQGQSVLRGVGFPVRRGMVFDNASRT